MYAERQMSPKAMQIAADRPDFWEYELTGVLIRDWVGPIERRYLDLQKGLYSPSKKYLPGDDFMSWVSPQMDTISEQTQVLERLVNQEIMPSWGAPGEPGSVEEIKRVCAYIADSCARLLEWEEGVRSVRTDEAFTEILGLFPGVGGPHISEIMKIPPFIEQMVSSGPKGDYHFTVTLGLPDGWEERFHAALGRLRDHLGVEE